MLCFHLCKSTVWTEQFLATNIALVKQISRKEDGGCSFSCILKLGKDVMAFIPPEMEFDRLTIFRKKEK